MIWVYLDWNVMSQLRRGQHPALRKLLGEAKFFVPYSTSHIDDLLSSNADAPRTALIDVDLDFISNISKNYYYHITVNGLNLSVRNPMESFDDRVKDNKLFENSNIDSLFADLAAESEEIRKTMEDLKTLPIDKTILDALKNPETKNQMSILFPGLNENPTHEGLIKSFGNMISSLNNSDRYKELRKMIQHGLGINRDQIYNSKNPFNIIGDAYEKTGYKAEDFIPKNKYTPDWFDTITKEYLKLDMHGFQEDKINIVKGRKETFRNTTEDASHAAFASTCHFYVTNDNKSYEKTTKVYDALKTNTTVFKPSNFITYCENFLFERSFLEELEIPLKILEFKWNYTQQELETGILRTYFVPFYIFDFFNSMRVLTSKSGKLTMIVLTQYYPSNKAITYHFEIEHLSKLLYLALGNDLNNLGPTTQTELSQAEWPDRKWSYKSINIRFTCVEGNFQLYYDFPEK